MITFTYTAANKQEKIISGTIEATDRSEAIHLLAKQNVTPISIKEQGAKPGSSAIFNFLGANKVKKDDLVMFTRQLSAMVSAGVPIIRALNSQREHTDSKALKAILSGVVKKIESGSQFADALAEYPNTFDDIYVNMVRAGEAAGILDSILKKLAAQQERNASMRKKVKGAMTYPIVLMSITVLAFFGLMIFVIPQIGNITKNLGGPDAKLPALTQIMLNISSFMIHSWYILIPTIIGIIIFILRWLKTPHGKNIFHHFILKLPGIKVLIQKLAVARFASTYSSLIGAGVAVLEALTVTSHAVGNVVFEKSIQDAAEQVKNGATLSSVIEKNPLFPPIVAQMLSVGEETGQTDQVLSKVADFYEEEVNVAIDGVSGLIEPVMIVIMGTMVGLIAASVMMPIAGLSQQIKG